MHRGDFARHKIETRQFLAQMIVMQPLDVIAQLRERQRVGIGLLRFRRTIQGGEHRHDRVRIEAFGCAGFGQRFLAAAAIVDAQIFKNSRARSKCANDFSDGGFWCDGFHDFVFGLLVKESLLTLRFCS